MLICHEFGGYFSFNQVITDWVLYFPGQCVSCYPAVSPFSRRRVCKRRRRFLSAASDELLTTCCMHPKFVISLGPLNYQSATVGRTVISASRGRFDRRSGALYVHTETYTLNKAVNAVAITVYCDGSRHCGGACL